MSYILLIQFIVCAIHLNFLIKNKFRIEILHFNMSMKIENIMKHLNLNAKYIIRIFKGQKANFLIIIILMKEIKQYLSLIIMPHLQNMKIKNIQCV